MCLCVLCVCAGLQGAACAKSALCRPPHSLPPTSPLLSSSSSSSSSSLPFLLLPLLPPPSPEAEQRQRAQVFAARRRWEQACELAQRRRPHGDLVCGVVDARDGVAAVCVCGGKMRKALRCVFASCWASVKATYTTQSKRLCLALPRCPPPPPRPARPPPSHLAHISCWRARSAIQTRRRLYASSPKPGWSGARSAPKPRILPLSTSWIERGTATSGGGGGAAVCAAVGAAAAAAAEVETRPLSSAGGGAPAATARTATVAVCVCVGRCGGGRGAVSGAHRARAALTVREARGVSQQGEGFRPSAPPYVTAHRLHIAAMIGAHTA